MLKATLGLIALTALSGCVSSPERFETPPVTVSTKMGPVVCQLYTERLVVWDRAIDRPEAMTVREADRVCQAAGHRQKWGEPISPAPDA